MSDAFRDFFERSPVAAYRADADGRLQQANAALVALLGFSSLDVMLADGALCDVVRGRDRAATLRRHDGAPLRVTHATWPLLDGDGRIGIFAVDETADAQAFLRSIVENIPNMIFIKDARELRFVLFNRAGEELLGYARESLVGKNDYDFFPAEEADFFTAKGSRCTRERPAAGYSG